jgi:hypothetical protein
MYAVVQCVGSRNNLFSLSVSDVPDVGPNGKPFSCEKCHSPFIVNPARRHKPDSKRKYRPRKVTDLVTKQVLLVCNACGLSMVRSKKKRHKKVCLCHKTKVCLNLFFVCSFTEEYGIQL